MERSKKIEILQKVANGQASIKDLFEKEMVHRICASGKGLTGLYVNGKLTMDENDVADFKAAFTKGLVKVTRLSTDI